MNREKSWKREVAVVLLLIWTLLVFRVFFFVDEVDKIETLGGILTGLTVWIIPPALCVFGFHHYINKKPDPPEKPDE